jgi:serine/threonine protein kinase
MNNSSALSSALPDQFGKYTVLRHLASGGMADLFLARATGIVGFEKIVVIKRIREDLAGDHEITELFLHEARLAATLEHPHIAQVYDVGIVNDSYFFAMEYVHGMDLRKIMRAAISKRRHLLLADAVQIAIGVCAALHHAHEKRDRRGNSLGIIHRDVSPSNVLVSYDGAVKVCDFGVAKATSRSNQTAHGVLKGKIAYMSPEQCQCQPLDRRSDIFAIGIVLHELLTLKKLFRGENDLAVLKQLTEGEIMLPSANRADFPPELERIVMKALSRSRDQRYATAQKMQLDLEAFARAERLALSSVSLEHLMAELFEGHVEAWQEALRDGKDLGEHLMERPASSPSATPTFDPPTPQAETNLQVGLASRSWRVTAPANLPWLSAALLAAFVGVGLVATGGGRDGELAALLQTEAEKIGATLDSEARALYMRADGIATMPMLRAAIGTDANTLRDMAGEFVFTPGKNEVLELFQARTPGKSESLLRIPGSAPPLVPLGGRDSRVEVAGGKLLLTVSAPVSALYRARAAGGSVALANAIDLSALRRRLGPRVLRAWLRGPGGTVPLVDGAGASVAAVAAQVPSSAEVSVSELSLEGIPRAADARWRIWAAMAAWALALALLVRLRRSSVALRMAETAAAARRSSSRG